MLMLDSVASPDWMNTRVLVMGSSSLADAAVDDVVVVSWAEIMLRSRKATRMNCGTLMIIFSFDKNNLGDLLRLIHVDSLNKTLLESYAGD
jgi:hypothetical protein